MNNRFAKAITIITTLGLFSCNDGNIELKNINFDNVQPQSCSDKIEETVYFKLKDNLSLILVLGTGIIKSEATKEDIVSIIPSQSTLYYRVFNSNISNSYFCGKLPPSTPLVSEEVVAKGGKVIIKTTENSQKQGVKTFDHTITIQDAYIQNSKGESIIDNEIYFGVITTNEIESQ